MIGHELTGQGMGFNIVTRLRLWIFLRNMKQKSCMQSCASIGQVSQYNFIFPHIILITLQQMTCFSSVPFMLSSFSSPSINPNIPLSFILSLNSTSVSLFLLHHPLLLLHLFLYVFLICPSPSLFNPPSSLTRSHCLFLLSHCFPPSLSHFFLHLYLRSSL